MVNQRRPPANQANFPTAPPTGPRFPNRISFRPRTNATMATAVAPPTAPARMRTRGGRSKEQSIAGNAANGQQPAVRLKAVVRHLPSMLKESEFCEAMSNYINDDTTDHFVWVQGKVPQDRNKAQTPSRCYVKMKDPTHIAALANAIKAHGMFTDSKGNSSMPQMEFSPFQKVPKKTQRIDSRAGTIESDPDFQAFLALLAPAAVSATAEGAEGAAPPPPLDPNAPAPIPANDPLSIPLPLNEPTEKPKTTPLIEFIRSQKAAPADKSIAPKARILDRTPESGRLKRSERRAREKAARSKGKEKENNEAPKIEPTALLKRPEPPRLARQGSSSIASSSASAAPKTPTGPASPLPAKPEENKEAVDKGKGRDRRRGQASSVAAILQRDLGLGGGRRTRGKAASTSESAPSTPTTTTPVTSAPTTPGPSAAASSSTAAAPAAEPARPPESPRRHRERPSRRERRAAKLEREESATSTTSTGSGAAAAPTPTPVAILKSQTSTGPGPVHMLMKRESTLAEASSGASTAENSPARPTAAPPSVNTNVAAAPSSPAAAVAPITPTTPTGPRGGVGGRGGRSRNRGGMMAVGNGPPQSPQAPQGPSGGPPTGPAAGTLHGPGFGGGRGGPRGGGRGGRPPMFPIQRGRGGGGPRGGMGPRGLPTAAAPAAAPANNNNNNNAGA